MHTDIEKIIAAAKAGGEILKTYFGQSLETTQKSNASDFRTKADVESEQAILKVLNREFPGYNMYSEETGEIKNGSEYTFFIDPLDGTNNFVLGIPNFSISIGLLKGDDIIAGVIYSPMIEYVYHAQKGKGAHFDGKQLYVNKERDIKNATIAYMCGYTWGAQEQIRVAGALYAKNTKRVLINWSPTFDFCMLACGKIEGIINSNTELYDFAAGKIIAKEAGALITTQDGKPEEKDTNRMLIASNGGTIHEDIIQTLRL